MNRGKRVLDIIFDDEDDSDRDPDYIPPGSLGCDHECGPIDESVSTSQGEHVYQEFLNFFGKKNK